MRFENIATKKENIKYNSGDVLVVCEEYDEGVYDEGAYMVFRKFGTYNLVDLNTGQVYFSDNRNYDDFAKNVGRLFYSAEIISNNELELVRVED